MTWIEQALWLVYYLSEAFSDGLEHLIMLWLFEANQAVAFWFWTRCGFEQFEYDVGCENRRYDINNGSLEHCKNDKEKMAHLRKWVCSKETEYLTKICIMNCYEIQA